ncbi:MAG: hypothetical protein F6J96_01170 [Symploca sp. SIO1C2]|nr:hypothetical protein [Symploca sp. SIO1C2]
MTLRTEPKDQLTEKVRQIIGEKIPAVEETPRAEAGLSTLSFQSLNYPERHIWIDTDGAGIVIDLEDWQDENEWDNAIARITVETIEEVVDIVNNWLSGANSDNYSNFNKEYGIVKKSVKSSVYC